MATLEEKIKRLFLRLNRRRRVELLKDLLQARDEGGNPEDDLVWEPIREEPFASLRRRCQSPKPLTVIR